MSNTFHPPFGSGAGLEIDFLAEYISSGPLDAYLLLVDADLVGQTAFMKASGPLESSLCLPREPTNQFRLLAYSLGGAKLVYAKRTEPAAL